MNEEEKQAMEYLKDFRNNVYNGVGSRSVMAKNIDIIFAIIEKQQKEIEDYQILKDDIEGHRIVYVDTPEFEENYISKDKIRELKEKVEKEMISNPYDFSYMINKLLGE